MKKRIISIVLTVCLMLSLNGCFPTVENNYSTVKTNNNERITIEELSYETEHITETPFENFTIDADINIAIKDNFNIYTANPISYDIESLKNIFLKDKKIVSSYIDEEREGYATASAADGSFVTVDPSLIKQDYLCYFSAEEKGESFEQYFYDSDGIKWDRDTRFPKKDLDFMSSDEACAIVDEKIKEMGLNASEYLVYPVDYDYIKEYDDDYNKRYSKYEGFDPQEHTKDDEFYFIIPRISLPNGSLIAELTYPAQVGNAQEVQSNIIYAMVKKSGLLAFICRGTFEVTDEKETKDIVGLDKALNTLKEDYENVESLGTNVYKIELSYAPYLIDYEQGIYELKPTWVFYMTRKRAFDGYTEKFVKLVDATTGNLLMTDNI